MDPEIAEYHSLYTPLSRVQELAADPAFAAKLAAQEAAWDAELCATLAAWPVPNDDDDSFGSDDGEEEPAAATPAHPAQDAEQATQAAEPSSFAFGGSAFGAAGADASQPFVFRASLSPPAVFGGTAQAALPPFGGGGSDAAIATAASTLGAKPASTPEIIYEYRTVAL